MNREEIARKEIGHTGVGRLSARILVSLFIVTLLLVPGVQFGTWASSDFEEEAGRQFPMLRSWLLPLRAVDGASEAQGSVLTKLRNGNRHMLREIANIEDDLDEVSVVGDMLRPSVQEALVRVGWGTERVLLGNQGWLFLKPAVDYLTGTGFLDDEYLQQRVKESDSWEDAPSPNPLPAIVEFDEQLKQRCIELILLPVPVKAGVVPERLSFRYPQYNEGDVLHNASWADFLNQLEESNVQVENIDAVLKELSGPFLKSDTHWNWASVDNVAQRLAERLRTSGMNSSCAFEEKRIEVTHRGDLYQMLPLNSTSLYPEESIEIRPVSGLNSGDDPCRSEVLLLGDSFSNIYSDTTLGWGADAGLAERLTWHLQAPVRSIIRNNDGAFTTRMELQRRLAQDPAFLDGIEFVVWEFTERELSFGDWRLMGRDSETTDTDEFVTLMPGETRRIEAVIQEMGEIPDPDEAAYADYIIALHLVEVHCEEQPLQKEALVFIWAMKDYQLLQGAFYNEGDQVTMQIQPWSDVSSSFDTMTRGELFSERLLVQDPCWAEEISE